MNIADILATVHLNLETGEFEATAAKAGDQAGVSAGQSFSSKFGAALKTGAGLALGAVFGMALTAGKELDAATQKLAADTGLTGQALAQQASSIDGLYKHSLQSMGDVEHALSLEISAYKLTGQAAEDAALGVIKFEEATGQGAEALDTLKEITDAYNLTAADQGHVMDLLVASHQQYSTNVGESQSALLKMAPALDAMNMSMDDGVALLNLFEVAGVDASKAPMALQKAIATLKPGQDLNDLIAQISSITDPTERAQAAMKIFGARGGAQLAQALQPGITSLDQFKTSTDSTVGASDRAAQAIEDSWGNRATLVLHQVAGSLGAIAEGFGPLLFGAALLGPKFTALISSAVGGLVAAGASAGAATGEAASAAEVATKQQLAASEVAAVEAVKTPLEVTAGAAEGAATGEAVVTAEAIAVAAGGPAVAGAVAAQGPAATTAGSALGRLIGLAAGVAIPLGLAGLVAAGAVAVVEGGAAVLDADSSRFRAAQLALAKSIAEGGRATLGDQSMLDSMGIDSSGSYDRQQKQAQAYLDNLVDSQKKADAAQLAQKQADAPGIFEADNSIAAMEATILASKKDIIARAVKDGYSGVPTAIEASAYEAKLALLKGLDDQVAAIKSKKSAFTSAWSDALDASSGPAERALAEYQLRCQMVSTTLLDDLKSNDATTRKMAQLQLKVYQDQYAKLLADDANYGTTLERQTRLNALLQSQALKDGLASTDQDTVLMWERVKADTQAALDSLNGIVSSGATTIGASFLAQLKRALAGEGEKVGTNPTNPRAFAGGTPYVPESGFYTVGERGTEQVWLPQGAAVVPHDQLGGVTQIFNFPHYVGSRSELLAAITKELRVAGG